VKENSITVKDIGGVMLKYNRPMNLFEKLHSGWWWIGQIFEEWCYTMVNEDGDFFENLQSDYVAYEEEMYYETQIFFGGK
jgi:hypothetical protein